MPDWPEPHPHRIERPAAELLLTEIRDLLRSIDRNLTRDAGGPEPVTDTTCPRCLREPDAACRDYHCPTSGAKAAAALTGLPSLIDQLVPPIADIRLVLEKLPHDLPGGLIGNTVEQGPPYNLYEPRARIAEAVMSVPRVESYGPNVQARVYEFGALLGYGVIAVAHRLGADRTTIGWCDNESHTPGSNETCWENADSIRVGMMDCCTDRRESPLFGRAHVVLVDGDHSYEATMDDLAYAYRMRPWLILVDDHIPEHAGVQVACRTIADPKVRIPTVNGLVAVMPGYYQAGLERLVESCGLEWEEVR